MSAIPDAISERMRLVLEKLVEQLDNHVIVCDLVKLHAWYDENYVGLADDKVATWRGFSANLRSLGNYRTIYINYVINHHSIDVNNRLFGEDFAKSVEHLDDYVCLYVTACPIKSISKIHDSGFTYKKFTRNIHPCRVVSTDDFLSKSISNFVDDGLKLILLQRDYCF
ncbi:MAG: hypothetical protein MUF87_02465 [Anaerolineae bacterium]|jgi:hypothetical protein|nr:hypothetical protein [Anaerolineae bacterium]